MFITQFDNARKGPKRPIRISLCLRASFIFAIALLKKTMVADGEPVPLLAAGIWTGTFPSSMAGFGVLGLHLFACIRLFSYFRHGGRSGISLRFGVFCRSCQSHYKAPPSRSYRVSGGDDGHTFGTLFTVPAGGDYLYYPLGARPQRRGSVFTLCYVNSWMINDGGSGRASGLAAGGTPLSGRGVEWHGRVSLGESRVGMPKRARPVILRFSAFITRAPATSSPHPPPPLFWSIVVAWVFFFGRQAVGVGAH